MNIVDQLLEEVLSQRQIIISIRDELRQLQKETDPNDDRWLSITELCEYLPGKPAKAYPHTKMQKRNVMHVKIQINAKAPLAPRHK